MQRRRNPINSLRCVMLLLIAMSLAIAPNVWAVSYNATALAAVVAAHEAEIEAHGHAHEDLDLERHAFDYHWSDIADFEQSSGWLPPSNAKGSAPLGDGSAVLTVTAPRGGLVRPFERPPRG